MIKFDMNKKDIFLHKKIPAKIFVLTGIKIIIFYCYFFGCEFVICYCELVVTMNLFTNYCFTE